MRLASILSATRRRRANTMTNVHGGKLASVAFGGAEDGGKLREPQCQKPGRFILLALRHKVFFRSKAGTSRRVNLNDMSAICRTGASGGSKCDLGQSESTCVKQVKVAF